MRFISVIRVYSFTFIACLGLVGQPKTALAREAQLVTISDISDLRPTDWAYQAIVNLADRYGCVAVFRDTVYAGQRNITRYQAASLLSSCMTKISESTDELRRLQEEFRGELAVLYGRTERLETGALQLSAMQFSTTTKLRGEASFILGAVNYQGDVRENGVGVSPLKPNQEALNFIYSIRIGFDTSFTGKDLLYTQIRSGNAANSPFNTFNPSTPWFTSTVPLAALERAYTPIGGNNVANIERLYYKFHVGSQVNVTMAAVIMNMGLWAVYPSAYGVRGDNLLDFFSSFGTPGVYNKAVGSALGFTWKEKSGWKDSSWFAHVHYLAMSGENSVDGGIGRSQSRGNIAAQFGYQSPQFNVTAGYRYGQGGTNFGRGTAFAEANQWSLPYLSSATSNSVALNGYWRPITRSWVPSISAGWVFNTLNNADITLADCLCDPGSPFISNSQSWMLGFQWDDLTGIHDVLGMAVGQPTFATALRDGSTPNDGNYALEVFYRYPFTNNINVTPSVFYLSRPYGQQTIGNFGLLGFLMQMNLKF